VRKKRRDSVRLDPSKIRALDLITLDSDGMEAYYGARLTTSEEGGGDHRRLQATGKLEFRLADAHFVLFSPVQNF
jgi:hypothetical protein